MPEELQPTMPLFKGIQIIIYSEDLEMLISSNSLLILWSRLLLQKGNEGLKSTTTKTFAAATATTTIAAEFPTTKLITVVAAATGLTFLEGMPN